jgi:hypothetical protein
MSNLENALKELREKRSRAQIEIEKLDQVISGIESLNGMGVPHKATQPIRIISAASRRNMARAQKARWASVRRQSQPAAAVAKTTGATPVKRTMSAAARRKIAATQKARWASLREKSQPIAVVAKTTGSAPAKRKISAAGRKRIAEATRARWAAFRAAKKKVA